MLSAPLLLLTAAQPQPVGEAAPVRQPAKPWVLDYAETNCTAVRSYETPRGQLHLALRPSPSGDVLRLTIVRQGTAPGAYHFRVAVSTEAHRAETTALRFKGDKGREIFWINLNRDSWKQLQSAKVLTIKGKPIDERLALPGIGAVTSGLGKCNEDLRRLWNVESAGGSVIAQPAEPTSSPQNWFNPGDYPGQSLIRGEEGRVGFMLLIDEAGVPKDCMIQATSGIASLDAMGCIAILKRAKFKPARNAAGKPVRSVWKSAVRWLMD